MARGGIYKSEVVRARDKLLAMGRYPSVDAVRQELGNTGSNTTIHRYLKEIDEEEGRKTGSKVAISEALQDLVARLSDRLQMEADSRIAEVTAQHANEMAANDEQLKGVMTEAAELREALEKLQAAMKKEQADHRETSERLHEEITAHARAAQQVSDLVERLKAEEEHRLALEEKHAHAREALEHFRTATKEQREQDVRQHEQQVQYLHGELKSLGDRLIQAQQTVAKTNQDHARIEAELSRSEQRLDDTRTELKAFNAVKEELAQAKQQLDRLGHRVIDLETQVATVKKVNEQLELERSHNHKQIHQLQIDLTAARSAAQTQNQLVEKIQVWMAQKPKTASKSGKARDQ